MTEKEAPMKRAARHRGADRSMQAEADIALAVARWETLHRLAAKLPHRQPHDPGRPPLFPPAAVLVFLVMSFAWSFERAVERAFSHKPTWEAIRRTLHERYPQYPGLRPGAAPMTRHHYRRFRDRYGIDEAIFGELFDEFRREAVRQARFMGLFDPANRSRSHPASENCVAGDGTVIRSRFKASRGDKYRDPSTDELIDKLFDPDARFYKERDEFGELTKKTVAGIMYGILHARLPFPAEQVILDIYHVTNGKNAEAVSAERAIERLQKLAPALWALVYDMAMRGRHRKHLYDLGLHLITKTPKVNKDLLRSRGIGRYKAKRDKQVVDTVDLWARDGALHLVVPVAGEKQFVRLEPLQIQQRQNKRAGKRRFRFYKVCRIPPDPRVPTRLRGATVTIHLNRDNAGFSWADNVHAFARGEADWERLFDLRNPTESLNALIKSKLHGPNRRAPNVGVPRQRFWLLGAALYINFQALLAHSDRLQRLAA